MTGASQLMAMLAVACVGVAATAEEDVTPSYRARYEWILAHYTDDGLNAAHRRLSKEWEADVHALTTVVNKADSASVRYCAITLLSDMRAQAAVRSLINRVGFYYPGAADWKVPLSAYPAAFALEKIGQPAVWQILVNRMRVDVTDEELMLFAAVIHGHYSFDGAVGRFHVERVIADVQKQIDGQKRPEGSPRRLAIWRQNLTRLLEVYDALDRGEPILAMLKREQETDDGAPSVPRAKEPTNGQQGSGSLP